MKKETLIWAAKLFSGIFILAVVLWWMVVPMWFGTIFVLIGIIIGLPHIWERFGKGSYVWSFWGGIIKRGNKISGLIAIYLLFRGSIAYLVRFPLASSSGRIHDNPLVTAIGFIHLSLLFEACFIFIVGGTIYMWFFHKKNWAKITTIITFMLLLAGTTWCLSNEPRVINAAIQPLAQDNMEQAIEKNGVIGGTVRQMWEFGFGKSTPKQPPATISTPAVYNMPGKNLTKTLQPDKEYVIDKLAQGDQWRFTSFNGTFYFRVNKGDNKACWKEVMNNLPWIADWAGNLEVKAGNRPVTLTVNILS